MGIGWEAWHKSASAQAPRRRPDLQPSTLKTRTKKACFSSHKASAHGGSHVRSEDPQASQNKAKAHGRWPGIADVHHP